MLTYRSRRKEAIRMDWLCGSTRTSIMVSLRPRWVCVPESTPMSKTFSADGAAEAEMEKANTHSAASSATAFRNF